MKKEWLFFCVFFTASLCPAILHTPLQLIASFSFSTSNNTALHTQLIIDADRFTTGSDAAFALPELSIKKVAGDSL